MELLMIVGLIAVVALLGRKLCSSADSAVREMEDSDLALAAARDMDRDLDESPHYDELARRANIRARLAK